MSAQLHSPTLGTFETDASLWQWLRRLDPIVQWSAAVGVSLSVPLFLLNATASMLLLSSSLVLVASARPAALERHHELALVRDAMQNLDQRLSSGDLRPEQHELRRAWLTAAHR